MRKIFLTVLLVALCACETEGEQPPLHEEPQIEETVFEIGQEFVNLTREVGRLCIEMTSSEAWIAEVDADWVSLSSESGEGSDAPVSLTVFYETNYGRMERAADVKISSGDSVKTVRLLQAAQADASISDFFRRVNKEEYAHQYICAHRANTYEGIYRTMDCPENSVRAVERCIEKGLDMVEIDVRMTKDGVLVCCHDEGITNVTNGSGIISDMTYAEICAFDSKVREKGLVCKGVKMNTLTQILNACKDRIYVNLDLAKVRTEEFAKAVADTVVACGMAAQVTCYIGTSAEYAMKYFDLCNDFSVHYYIGAVASVENISGITTMPLIQFANEQWDGTQGTTELSDGIRNAGLCGLSNMLDYDSKVIRNNGDYIDHFTAARIDFVQTDYGDHEVFQQNLKDRNLR